METYSTFDYSRFKFLKENRTIDHAATVAKSIEKADLTKYKPILVTKDFEIIDGQNTFEACKLLGKPIHYAIVDTENISIFDAILALNTGQRSWRNENYVQSWISRGHKKMIEFVERAKSVGFDDKRYSVASLIYFGASTSITKQIREGNLPEKWEFADEIAEFLKHMQRMQIGFWRTAYFVEAIVAFRKTHTEKEMHKLIKHIDIVAQYGSRSAYVNRFQQIVDSKKVK